MSFITNLALGALGGNLLSGSSPVSAAAAAVTGTPAADPSSLRNGQMSELGGIFANVNSLGSLASSLLGGGTAGALLSGENGIDALAGSGTTASLLGGALSSMAGGTSGSSSSTTGMLNTILSAIESSAGGSSQVPQMPQLTPATQPDDNPGQPDNIVNLASMALDAGADS